MYVATCEGDTVEEENVLAHCCYVWCGVGCGWCIGGWLSSWRARNGREEEIG
jgi:hypothetical protein